MHRVVVVGCQTVIPAVQQLRTIGAFGRLVASGAIASIRQSGGYDLLLRPRVTGMAPRVSSRAIVRYLQATGADPESYRAPGRTYFVPPTFFSTWALPEFAKALAMARLPFNFARALHASSSVRMHRMFTCEEPLAFSASVEGVERTGQRVRIDQQLELGEPRGGPVMTATLSIVLPERRRSGSRTPEIVPANASQLSRLELPANEGWRYARLSGDFNPVHWSRTAARFAGLPGPIAHGFDLMTCVSHAVVAQLASSASGLRALSVAFRAPVVLPARLNLLTATADPDTGQIPLWLAAGPGSATHLSGHVELGS